MTARAWNVWTWKADAGWVRRNDEPMPVKERARDLAGYYRVKMIYATVRADGWIPTKPPRDPYTLGS
jgi:hypothetical protein